MLSHSSYNCLIFFTIVVSLATGSNASNFERNLLDKLLKDYNKNQRPVVQDKEKVTVYIGLSLHQIMDVDEKNQIITISVWARQKWNNPYLKWDKEKYGNLTAINIPSTKVWVPDIVLYNNADDSIDFRGHLDHLNTRIQLFHDGTSKWLAPVMLRSKCKIDVQYFPFDSQVCQLKFGSWTYDGLRLDVQNESNTVDLGMNIASAEWFLKKAPVKRNVLKYYCCPQPYPDVTFYLHIQRRTLFYLSNLILPLTVISILIPFIFTLPPESGERVSLSITILLAMTVFMLLVTDIIPPTSESIPLIAKFYMAAMFETALALLATCYILRCYHSKANEVPLWAKTIFVGKLAGFFGIKKSKALLQEEKKEEEQIHWKRKNAKFVEQMMTSLGTIEQVTGLLAGETVVRDQENNELLTPNGTGLHHAGDGLTAMDKNELRSMITWKIWENVEMISDNIIAKEKVDRVKEQWHIIALVVDRIAMWVFAAITALTIALIFYNAPGYVS